MSKSNLDRAKVRVLMTKVDGTQFEMNHSTLLVDGHFEFLTDAQAQVIYDDLCDRLAGHVQGGKKSDE